MTTEFVIIRDDDKTLSIIGHDLIEHHVYIRIRVVFERKVPQNTLEYEIELVV